MAERFPAVYGVTPKVTAGYAKFVYERDMKFGPPGKYKITVALDPENPEHKAFMDERIARHMQAGGSEKNCPVKKGNTEWKQDPALCYITFKTTRAPRVVDAKRQDITDSEVLVFSGDTIRVAFKDNPNSPTPGCFLYLNKIQLVEKKEKAADFDDVDGFVASDAELKQREATVEAETSFDDGEGDF